MSIERPATDERDIADDRVSIEAAYDLAQTTHNDRSAAAMSRRAVALLKSEVSVEDAAEKPEVYDEARRYAEEVAWMHGSDAPLGSSAKPIDTLRSYEKTKTVRTIEGSVGFKADGFADRMEQDYVARPSTTASARSRFFKRGR